MEKRIEEANFKPDDYTGGAITIDKACGTGKSRRRRGMAICRSEFFELGTGICSVYVLSAIGDSKGVTMERAGGCRCGAIRFAVMGEPQHVALCHCRDCRHNAGAPMVAWATFVEGAFRLVAGAPVEYNPARTVQRSFCGTCGTGLFYRNPEFLPGLIDIQAAVFDEPETLAPDMHIQFAERLPWMDDAHALPKHERFPKA